MGVEEELNQNTFSIEDYCVFGAMLAVSSLIGIYFACQGKQNSTKEYLMAGRDMTWFPLFVSLLASYLSAITLLGVPSEIFTYGIQYIVLCFSYFILVGAGAIIFLPIFYKLQVVSSNEYLEKRFSEGIRYLGCGLVSFMYILYLSVVLFAPSLAMEAVAGIPLEASIITTGLVCTFYTTLGGMKAVIWTDVFQAGVMVTGLIVVIIVGVIELGGFGEVFRLASEGERMTVFDFNPDPRMRNSFWTLAIGGAFTAMPVWTVCQPAVQRFQAAKTMQQSRKALLMNIPGLIFIVLLCVMDGLVIYGVYQSCDIGVYGLKAVTSNDQVLPYFIIHKLGKYKGVPGIFTSCLFSGALSTASSGMNSVAAVFLEDIVKKRKPDITDTQATWVSKGTACFLGILVIGLAFLVKSFGSLVLQLAYSIFGVIGGPYLGLFFLGMMVPWSTWKGAYVGAFVGVTCTLWLCIGAIVYPPNKHPAMVRLDGCASFNNTNSSFPILRDASNAVIRPALLYKEPDTSMMDWYSISYLWYAAIGVSFTFVAGCIASLIFKLFDGDEKSECVAKELLFDYRGFFLSFVPKSKRQSAYSLRSEGDREAIPLNDGTTRTKPYS